MVDNSQPDTENDRGSLLRERI